MQKTYSEITFTNFYTKIKLCLVLCTFFPTVVSYLVEVVGLCTDHPKDF